jgi:cullin 4
LNIDSSLIAEYLAKWLDYNLKQIDDRALKVVKEVTNLLKLVKAKDVFQEFYMRGLSRRLLLKKVRSIESEKAIVQHLKDECSGDMDKKAEIMFRDI